MGREKRPAGVSNSWRKKVSQPIADWARQSWGEVIVDQNRADLLDKLYFWDGRDKKDHPLHSTYTGLYRKYTAN
jgi:hypothetical protein